MLAGLKDAMVGVELAKPVLMIQGSVLAAAAPIVAVKLSVSGPGMPA